MFSLSLYNFRIRITDNLFSVVVLTCFFLVMVFVHHFAKALYLILLIRFLFSFTYLNQFFLPVLFLPPSLTSLFWLFFFIDFFHFILHIFSVHSICSSLTPFYFVFINFISLFSSWSSLIPLLTFPCHFLPLVFSSHRSFS